MPQATSINGVATTVDSRAYQGPGIGEQMVQMAEAFTKVKQAEKDRAMQQLQVMLQNVDKLPIDDKAIRKTAKKAGLPLANDETIAAVAHAAKTPQAASTASKPVTPQAGGAPAPAPQAAGGAGAKDPNAAVAEAQKKMQDNMTPEQAKTMVFEQFAAKARALSESKFKDEKAKTDYNTHLSLLKDAAIGGDGIAAGKLMAAGEVPFNITQLAWNGATPEAKTKMYEIAMGHETDAQQKEREGAIMNGLLQHTGLSAADAYSAAHAMAAGQPLSGEIQKKMGTPSFKELGDEADFMKSAYELGVPADKIQAVAQNARASGSLIGALPKGLQPVFQKQMEMKSRELNIEQQRVNVAAKQADTQEKRAATYDKMVDATEATNQAKIKLGILKLQMDETKGANKEYLDSLKIAIAQKKAGIEVDEKTKSKIMDGLKGYSDDAQGLYNYLTGAAGAAAGAVDKAKSKAGSTDPLGDELN